MKDPVLTAKLEATFDRWIDLCTQAAVQDIEADADFCASELQWLRWRKQWVAIHDNVAYVQQVIVDVECACDWLHEQMALQD